MNHRAGVQNSIKGPASFLAPFMRDTAPFDTLENICRTICRSAASLCGVDGARSAFNINVGDRPWGCGIWESKREDLLFTVTYGGIDNGGRQSEFPVACRLPLNIVMLQRRNADGNFDGVLVVYDRVSDAIHHFHARPRSLVPGRRVPR